MLDAVLLLRFDDVELEALERDAAGLAIARQLSDALRLRCVPVAVTTSQPSRFLERAFGSALIEWPRLDMAGRTRIWSSALARHVSASTVQPLAEALGVLEEAPAGRIVRAVQAAVDEQRGPRRAGRLRLEMGHLRHHLRLELQHDLGSLADPVHPQLTLDDVVLSDEMRRSVEQVLRHARFAHQVFEEWGLERYCPTGRGLSVLFSGPPGTGKTLVASILAGELQRPLYRVDLSRIVDKYVGETEKNLARVFDAAERSQAVLLFDEADSLFAARTSIKSSNDRYANLEVNFLLQRLDDFPGVSILTTNHAQSIDEAFQRRLRYQVEFPMPDAALRAELWQRLLPPGAPLSPDIDFEALGEAFELSGGHVRNAVLRAALEAAECKAPINHAMLWVAATAEAREMGQLVSSGGRVYEDFEL